MTLKERAEVEAAKVGLPGVSRIYEWLDHVGASDDPPGCCPGCQEEVLVELNATLHEFFCTVCSTSWRAKGSHP